jgi:hypothetical protein
VPFLFLVHGDNHENRQFELPYVQRTCLKTPLRVRIWKSAVPEETAESLKISQYGVYFETNSAIREGEWVKNLLNMPEEIRDELSTEVRFPSHIVRAERVDSTRGTLVQGVQFNCHKISRVEIRAVS